MEAIANMNMVTLDNTFAIMAILGSLVGWVKRSEPKKLRKECFMAKERLPKQYLQIKKS